uniref:IMS_C domain-containing protein n=1 Tax=Meloidogyne hapla TaxID=6305 RepID=A0A1I8BYZ8_MELHA
MYTFDVAHFEISVALNHDVDDLLVGIVAQIKDSFQMNISTEIDNSLKKNKKLTLSTQNFTLQKDSNEDFQAAIRRFSRRKKRQMHVNSMEETGKCLNLFTKLKIWRKGSCS